MDFPINICNVSTPNLSILEDYFVSITATTTITTP